MSKSINIPAAITRPLLLRLTPNQFYFVANALGYKKCPRTFWVNIQYFWPKFEVQNLACDLEISFSSILNQERVLWFMIIPLMLLSKMFFVLCR